MNVERYSQISKKQARPEEFSNICSNLADRLTGNRWDDDEVRQASLSRQLIERIGEEGLLHGNLIESINNEVEISFFAEKTERTRDERHYQTETYHLEGNVMQDVVKEEIPQGVLTEIFEDAEDGELGEDFEELSIDQLEDLDNFDITRKQSVEYLFDEDGNILNYAQSYSYLFDGTVMHEVAYDSMVEESHSRLTVPVKSHDGEVLDWRPSMTLVLTEGLIKQEAARLEKAWEEFLTERELHEMMTFAGMTPMEHRRRALSMIAMLGSGLFQLRDLSRR